MNRISAAQTHDHSFMDVGTPKRVWTVPSIHGDLGQLIRLHNQIFDHFTVGDRLIYLGNYTGYGKDSATCVDEILTFRRLLLSLRGMDIKDIVYLRGGQEEILQKLLQLHFAPQPADVFLWMLSQGLKPTLHSYGLCEHDGIEACRSGASGLNRWIQKVRDAIRARPGHERFYTQFYRAAYTNLSQEAPMLFVNAGLEPSRTLSAQGDMFWWSGHHFDQLEQAVSPYKPFEKIIRGYDPLHRGCSFDHITATIDDGCGFGGNLISAAFAPNGELVEVLQS